MQYVSRRFVTPLLIAFCAVSMPAISQNSSQNNAQNPSQTRYIRFGIGLSEDHPQGMAVRKFAEIVSEKTQGRIKIELFAGGKLGNDVSMTDALKAGKLEMTAPDTSSLVRFTSGFGVINFPFLLSTEQDADALLDSKFGNELLATLPAHGLVGLAWWENGFRNLTNSRSPVTRRTDLMDLKVRVMPNAMFSDTFQTLGAQPLKLPFPEVYANLKEGKVQAQENPLITIYASKFYEVQQHLTLSRHAYSAWPVLISKPVWESFSAADQAILKTAALESSKYQRELIRSRNAQMVDELKKLGMKVTEIDRAELPLIRLSTRKVIDKYAKEFGEDWTKKLYLQLAINEHNKLQRSVSR
ncbi:TRAP transporter substrate-binding protein [Variovorax sp. PCZ-1]|uniref:TRAP transporter substrate-binding protein n=1 Tax=Variovorax sp. PCZ-1 TaxID=2835533 RepID=UPI001BCD864E|nr:TRAP transporter substrate-binding protein [Variovorax sp. PCZ-1]MBS7806160.1 TRAP transporter substrate-binding protein [Variovorax sp. PCZ-1]